MTALLLAQAGVGIVHLIIYLLVFGLIFWMLWWLVQYISPPEPFKKVITVILAVAAVIVIINALLGLIGRPLFVL